MKMKTIYYLFLLVLGCGFVSCYDDKSTYDTKDIPNGELDVSGHRRSMWHIWESCILMFP